MFEKLGYYVEWNGDLKRIEVSGFLSDEKSAFIENRVDMRDDIGLYNHLNGGLATVHNGYIYIVRLSLKMELFLYTG